MEKSSTHKLHSWVFELYPDDESVVYTESLIHLLNIYATHPRQQDDALNASTAYIAVNHQQQQ